MKLSSWPWFVLLIATILVQFSETNGCFPEEKRALLDFKVTLSNQSLLPSWVDYPKSNCCVWERVTCDPSSHHVTHLSLHNITGTADYYSYLDKKYGCFSSFADLNLNWDLFLSFKELRSLNLSCIGLYGVVRKGDYRSKSALKKLETLDLSGNNLNETMLEFLNDLPSLKNLILHYNYIGGPFPMKELSLLPNLELLDLSLNNLNSSFTTQDYRSQSILKRLKTLDLSFNNLNGTMMEFFSALPSLKNLILAYNDIGGSFPIKDYRSQSILKRLETLDLSWNHLNETMMEFFSALPSLKNLILSYNGIEGSFPMKDYRSQSILKRLETLDLSWNHLNETMMEFFSALPSLKNLILAGNYIGGSFPIKDQ